MKDDALCLALAESFEPQPDNPTVEDLWKSKYWTCTLEASLSGPPYDIKPRDFINDPELTVMMLHYLLEKFDNIIGVAARVFAAWDKDDVTPQHLGRAVALATAMERGIYPKALDEGSV